MELMNSSSNKKEYKSWSKSSEKDGWTKRISVYEIENGYLVCLNEYGERDGEYKDITKKYFSETNPLDGMTPDSNYSDKLRDTIKDFLEEF